MSTERNLKLLQKAKAKGYFKKRKDECFYEECDEWLYEDIGMLTNISEMESKDLN